MRSLILDGLAKKYPGGKTAVEGISLDLDERSFTTLLGPSGCGKTTTLRCLAGLETPDGGRIQFGDETFVDVDAGILVPPHKRKLGMVFQSYALWPNRTVLGNVAYPLRLRGQSKSDAAKRAAEVLSTVGLDGYGERYPHELSGGQQQRVALARGLASGGGLLLFDEPLSNLDANLRLEMRTEIRRLHDEFGYSSVYVTHDQEEALAISDTIVVINDGKVEQAGTPYEIFAKPASSWVAQFVGFDNIHEIALADPADGRVDLRGGGSIHGPIAAMKSVPGEKIAFRSRDVVFADQAPREEPHFRIAGRVLSSSYLGDSYRLVIEAGKDSTFIATVPDSTRIHTPEKYRGEIVKMAIPVAHTIFL